MQKRIVAVIPLYNKAATINRALASIMAQTRRPDAVVVVDDGSTDDSVARIEPHYRAQIELLSIPNGGPGGARSGLHRGAAVFREDWRPLREGVEPARQDDPGQFVVRGAEGDRHRLTGRGLWRAPIRRC